MSQSLDFQRSTDGIVCRRIVNPNQDEKKAILNVLVDGVRDYRPIVLISEENDDLLRLYHSAILEAGLSHGEVWVAGLEGEEEIGAIAIWWPPGSKFDDQPIGLELMAKHKASVSPEHRAWMDGEFREIGSQCKAALGAPSTDRFHLSYWATLPSKRRRGLGSALGKIAMDKAKAVDKPMTLLTHSAANAQSYARAGFRIAWEGEYAFLNGERHPFIGMVNGPIPK